ncbi:uncharacterized protein H6S33_007321 [Morchella sextelata]|uniref:uncharacterized protein n=1 Tax=Morchella sextelata TaxID=1174677 RepID=UPI001D057FFC|nr:uncharacterized protein H6S33_007321 [Morchella sextelata]KAH0603662.1 hypothetical protein H6S33_007321 [Morchella sextelata]
MAISGLFFVSERQEVHRPGSSAGLGLGDHVTRSPNIPGSGRVPAEKNGAEYLHKGSTLRLASRSSRVR